MKRSTLALVCVLSVAAGCSKARAPQGAASPPPVSHVEVKTWGSLRAMMHEGKLGPTVRLRDLVPGPDTYAVGALSELRGEVTVIGDQIWLAYPDENEVRVERPTRSDEEATLLVSARVPAWRSVRIDQPLAYDELAVAIEDAAKKAGLDVARAFPVVIEGQAAHIAWHVIDGKRLRPGDGHREHMRTAIRRSAENVDVRLVGFFSKRHQGVFTHMGERIHFHAVIAERQTGHVDDAALLAGVVLKLPATGHPTTGR